MKTLFVFLVLGWSLCECKAQFELVPYGDFETPQLGPETPCPVATFGWPLLDSWQDLNAGGGNAPRFYSEYFGPGDCDVPNNTTFGTQDSEGGTSVNKNYVGLQSGNAGFRRDGIKTKLKHRLLSGHQYILRFSAVKKSSGDPEVEFRFGKTDDWNDAGCPSCSQSFMTIAQDGGPNNDQWGTYSVSFTPDECDYMWLFIRLQSSATERILLIDNISINDECAANYMCGGDFGNLEGITCNGYHDAQMPLTFFNLDRVDEFELQIKTVLGQQIIRTLHLFHPSSTLSWDGKNENGQYVANGAYIYTLNLRNSCQCGSLEGVFLKTGDPHTITTFVAVDANYGLLNVFNLSNITWMIMTIYDSDDQEIFTREIFNPANAVAWNGLNNHGGFATSGQYRYIIQVRNPCEILELDGFFSFVQLGPPVPSSPNIDYNSYPKTVACPFVFNYFQYDYAPTPCCPFTSDWYISDKHLTGIQDYKVGHDIIAVQNNIVEAGSDIYFQAGHEIILNPDFTVEPGAEFEAVILPCTGRMQNPLSQSDEDEETEEATPWVTQPNPKGSFTPNPSDGTFQVELNGIREENLLLYVTDIYGRIVYSTAIPTQSAEKSNFTLDLNALDAGLYSCSIYQNEEQILVEKLIVQ